MLLLLLPLCIGVGQGNIMLFLAAGKDVPEGHAYLPGGASAPPGGVCSNIGQRFPDNPFHGWPTDFHPGDWSTISAWWCDPDYFPGYTHWGIDIAASYRANDWDVEGHAVLCTALVGRIRRAAFSVPPEWNSGMGNFVEVEAYEPTGRPTWWCTPSVTMIPTPTSDPTCGCALDHVVDPTQLTEEEWRALVQNDIDTGHFDECWQPTGWVATYMHLQDITVAVDDIVVYGETLGHIDNTGNSSGTHLHYQINMPGADSGKGAAIDPAPTMAETYSDGLRALPRRQR